MDPGTALQAAALQPAAAQTCGPPKDHSIPSMALGLASQVDWILVTSVLIPWLPQKPALRPHGPNWHLFAKKESPFSAVGLAPPTLFALSITGR